MASLRLDSAGRSRRQLVAALIGLTLAAVAPTTASAHRSIALRYQKVCLGTTCTGTLVTHAGRPIPGTSVTASLSPLWFESGIVGFTATETIASTASSFTMNHVGVADQKRDPDAIYVLGAVTTGSWNGIPLAGALVRIRAAGIPPSSVVATVRIDPPRRA
jgi:hypothetical protein